MRNPDSKHWVFLRDLEIPLGEKSRFGILKSRLEKQYAEGAAVLHHFLLSSICPPLSSVGLVH